MEIGTVILVLVGAACLAGALSMWLTRAARVRRRARLFGREPVDEQQWFAQYFPQGLRHPDCLTEILEALGTHLGVPWTCLHPDDTFSGSLAVEGTPFADEELLEFECFVESWLKKNGIACDEVRAMDSLGAFLSELDALLSRRPRPPPIPRLTERGRPRSREERR